MTDRETDIVQKYRQYVDSLIISAPTVKVWWEVGRNWQTTAERNKLEINSDTVFWFLRLLYASAFWFQLSTFCFIFQRRPCHVLHSTCAAGGTRFKMATAGGTDLLSELMRRRVFFSVTTWNELWRLMPVAWRSCPVVHFTCAARNLSLKWRRRDGIGHLAVAGDMRIASSSMGTKSRGVPNLVWL